MNTKKTINGENNLMISKKKFFQIANANMVAISIIVKCIAMFLWSITT